MAESKFLEQLREKFRKETVKRRLKAAFRRKPRPARVKESDEVSMKHRYYILSPRIIVIGELWAESQDDAQQLAREQFGPGARVTSAEGKTAEQAEDFVREELKDDK